MSEYEFRLRFNLAEAYRIGSDAEELELLVTPSGQKLRLRTSVTGTPIKEHPRAAVLGGSFGSEGEARIAVEKSKRALLYWAIEQRLGIDFGDGKQRSIATNAGLAMLQEQYGCPFRNDVHGIDVYERVDKLRFVSVTADAKVSKHPPNLIDAFGREYLNSRHLTEKQILAGEIYSSSFFDISQRSRFITLVTAVEALSEPAQRSDVVQTLVTDFEARTRQSSIDESVRASIHGSLQWIRYESIGEAGRALTLRLLPNQRFDGQSSSDFFTRSYKLRSQILHRGAIGDETDMWQLASTMETFVAQLLIASLNSGAQHL